MWAASFLNDTYLLIWHNILVQFWAKASAISVLGLFTLYSCILLQICCLLFALLFSCLEAGQVLWFVDDCWSSCFKAEWFILWLRDHVWASSEEGLFFRVGHSSLLRVGEGPQTFTYLILSFIFSIFFFYFLRISLDLSRLWQNQRRCIHCFAFHIWFLRLWCKVIGDYFRLDADCFRWVLAIHIPNLCLSSSKHLANSECLELNFSSKISWIVHILQPESSQLLNRIEFDSRKCWIMKFLDSQISIEGIEFIFQQLRIILIGLSYLLFLLNRSLIYLLIPEFILQITILLL